MHQFDAFSNLVLTLIDIMVNLASIVFASWNLETFIPPKIPENISKAESDEKKKQNL